MCKDKYLILVPVAGVFCILGNKYSQVTQNSSLPLKIQTTDLPTGCLKKRGIVNLKGGLFSYDFLFDSIRVNILL